MADEPNNSAESLTGAEFSPVDPAPNGDAPPSLPVFRFGLRQLFIFLTAVSILLAIMAILGGLAALALLLAALVIAAHVGSTALGSHLRKHADEVQAVEFGQRDGGEHQTGGTTRYLAALQRSRSAWHGRGTVALPWLPRLIVIGVVVGGAAGALLLAATIGHRTSPAGIVIGALSMAVIGGWFAFLGGSFYGILRHGFREATAHHRLDHTARDAARRGGIAK